MTEKIVIRVEIEKLDNSSICRKKEILISKQSITEEFIQLLWDYYHIDFLDLIEKQEQTK